MALRKTTRPLPRTPRVTARTPLLKRATSTTASTTVAATGTLPIATLAPGVATAANSGTDSHDVFAAMEVSYGSVQPVEEDALANALTVDLRDKILEVVTETVRLWLQLAHFQNVSIQIASAIAPAGCLQGPRLRDYRQISNAYHSTTGLEREVMDMALRGISDNFALWQSFVIIPGLPLFPSFAAIPMAEAPPTPAVPMPLSAFPSGQVSMILSDVQLRNAMLSEAPNDLNATDLADFCQNIGKCCALAFQIMVSSQVVVRMLGTGPVPSFAPPYVPVGPVMGGTVIAAPGMFAAPGSFSIPKLPLNI